MRYIDCNQILKIMCRSACEVFEARNAGEKSSRVFDCLATKRFDDLMELFSTEDIRVLSIEGERDGVYVSNLQKMNSANKADMQIALDPIDGTTSFSMNGSRATSALAIDTTTPVNFRRLPDSLSCFCVASNYDKHFLDNLNYIPKDREALKKKLKNIDSLSTLNRSESRELWNYFLGEEMAGVEGERTFYLPSYFWNNIYFAGDSSIPLFIESDHFLGRVGASEAMIESQLWKYWRGMLVSGAKMKLYRHGAVEYIKRRIASTQKTNQFELAEFFLPAEIKTLKEFGWEKKDILEFHSKETFSPPFNFILIGSLTGTKDSVLPIHSKRNLNKAIYNETGFLKMQCWMKHEDFCGIIDCYYNVKEETIVWKKNNI